MSTLEINIKDLGDLGMGREGRICHPFTAFTFEIYFPSFVLSLLLFVIMEETGQFLWNVVDGDGWMMTWS